MKKGFEVVSCKNKSWPNFNCIKISNSNLLHKFKYTFHSSSGKERTFFASSKFGLHDHQVKPLIHTQSWLQLLNWCKSPRLLSGLFFYLQLNSLCMVMQIKEHWMSSQWNLLNPNNQPSFQVNPHHQLQKEFASEVCLHLHREEWKKLLVFIRFDHGKWKCFP